MNITLYHCDYKPLSPSAPAEIWRQTDTDGLWQIKKDSYKRLQSNGLRSCSGCVLLVGDCVSHNIWSIPPGEEDTSCWLALFTTGGRRVEPPMRHIDRVDGEDEGRRRINRKTRTFKGIKHTANERDLTEWIQKLLRAAGTTWPPFGWMISI